MAIRAVQVIIDHQKHDITPGLTTGPTLLSLANLSGSEQLLLEVPNDPDIPVDAGDSILIRGGEIFSIGKGAPPLEDNPHLHHGIRVHMNGEKIPEDKAFHHAKVHASELRALDPDAKPGDAIYADLDDLADEVIPDGVRLILQPNDKFGTSPSGNVGGNDLLQEHLEEVQFSHPDAYLAGDDGPRYLVVPGYQLPETWGRKVVTLLIQIPNGYPQAAPDMFWVAPEIHLANGSDPDRAGHREIHLGQQWQRFSWHYCEPHTAWRPATSSLLSHLRFCTTRFANVA
jgi:hypothetical protein